VHATKAARATAEMRARWTDMGMAEI